MFNKRELTNRLTSFVEKPSAERRSSSPENLKLPNSIDTFSNLNADTRRMSEQAEEIEKLKGRVEVLEEQNDYLVNSIQFVFENFSELVRNCQKCDEKEREEGTEVEKESSTHIEAESMLADADLSKTETSPLITKREKEVFNLLIKGLCAKEIANLLFISETGREIGFSAGRI